MPKLPRAETKGQRRSGPQRRSAQRQNNVDENSPKRSAVQPRRLNLFLRQALQLRAQGEKHQRRMLDAQQERYSLGGIKRVATAKPWRQTQAVEQNAAGAE
ncbi:Uncharacterised protein [Cedecea neteri]|uniref:Uncharacterized protein n=1 Tax=Cedecea neteri TaxID=158822 RepID=A0A2X3JH75_9ENTR|nr:Uncharacterised protein [Cedecea neteri]